MKQNFLMFVLAVLVLGLLVMVALGFMVGAGSPLPWVGIVGLVVVYLLHGKYMRQRFLVWDESYSVGIEVIDNDHKKLLNLINQLQTASQYRIGEEFEKQALEEVVDYTRTHFGREEHLLEEHGYPQLEPHKREHAQMIAEVDRFVQQYEQDSDRAINDALIYLKSWLIKHINGTDQQYSAYLQGKGVH